MHSYFKKYFLELYHKFQSVNNYNDDSIRIPFSDFSDNVYFYLSSEDIIEIAEKYKFIVRLKNIHNREVDPSWFYGFYSTLNIYEKDLEILLRKEKIKKLLNAKNT